MLVRPYSLKWPSGLLGNYVIKKKTKIKEGIATHRQVPLRSIHHPQLSLRLAHWHNVPWNRTLAGCPDTETKYRIESKSCLHD